jgi:hypothetical protein
VILARDGSRARRTIACAFVLLVMCIGNVQAEAPARASNAGPAAALRAKFASLEGELANNPFQRPLAMRSSEGRERVAGEIHAIVNHPFAVAGPALMTPAQWCDILILHLNTKSCRPSSLGSERILQLSIGKKFDQPLEDAYRVDFSFTLTENQAKYVRVTLDASKGPLGTHDYKIILEAMPSDDSRSLIHITYSYSFDTIGRMAMQTYLGTIGRNKVGFTSDGTDSDGAPRYVGGMRGVIERNTMRYYLAIEAYLGALSLPASARMEKSLLDWFSANERYPRQLHDMERAEYLEMKRREYARQQPGAPARPAKGKA